MPLHKFKPLNLRGYISMFTPKSQTKACLRLYDENEERFCNAPGSSNNHQAWPGGYYDHLVETMSFGWDLYNTVCWNLFNTRIDGKRPPTFRFEDVVLVLFLHDVEKPWKYETVGRTFEIKSSLRDKNAQKRFRYRMIKKYDIQLSAEQKNALEYVEGEGNAHSTKGRTMGKLAGFCHMCDIASARLWPDYPLPRDRIANSSNR